VPNSRSPRAQLTALAKAAGLMPSYVDATGVRRKASEETLLAALCSLGVKCETTAGSGKALARLLRERASRRLEPITVAWTGRRSHALYRLPTTASGDPKATGKLTATLVTESREVHDAAHALAELAMTSRTLEDGSTAYFVKVPLPKLEMGYHKLRTKLGSREDESLVVCAPIRSYQAGEAEGMTGDLKSLGLFCPTYSIRSENNLGCGNLTDLRELAAWAGSRGCDLISTLPLLAVFLDDSPLHEPAPYSPVSRLFWNELFLDPFRTELFGECAEARRIAGSAAFQRTAAELRSRPDRVDYKASAALQNQLLDALAASFFEKKLDKSASFREHLQRNQLTERYARFRAVCAKRGESWRFWPERLRGGDLKAADGDRTVERRHLFAQFAMTQQMAGFSEEMAERRGRLYLDLAIGVHPDGFDVWHEPNLFMLGSVVGAPPDPMFTEGQNWGFPPMHPEAARETGYCSVINALRTHMQHAHFLRLDHVMGFHRLFLIPEGLPSSKGVYVRYRDDELFAILSLESHRHNCRLIGENLGTVPKAVEKLMTKHQVGKLYVGQFNGTGKKSKAMREVPRDVAASLNTHDLPTFAHNFRGDDIPERIDAGVFNPDLEVGERKNRERDREAITPWVVSRGYADEPAPDAVEVGVALYRFLAESDAELALVNLEDLWGETHWQNIPGTTDEHANWQHKLRRTLNEIERDGRISALLEDFASRRRGERAAQPKRSKRPTGRKKTTKAKSSRGKR